MKTLIKTMDKAWAAFKQGKRYLILALLIDFLFIFATAQAHLYFFIPTSEAMLQTQEAMANVMENLSETELMHVDTILGEDPAFKAAYRTLLTYIVLFFLSLLALWLIFKSFVWYLAHKSIHKKLPLAMYAPKFILLSCFWFVLMVSAIFLHQALLAGPIPLAGQTASTLVLLLLFAVVFYFANISFALIPAKQTFKKSFIFGYNHAKTILPAYLVNLLLLFLGITLPVTLGKFNPLYAFVVIIIFTIPALAFARLHMIVASWLNTS